MIQQGTLSFHAGILPVLCVLCVGFIVLKFNKSFRFNLVSLFMLSFSPRAHFRRTLFRYEAAPSSLSKWALQASGSGLGQGLLRVVHLPPTLSERKRLLRMLKDISAVLINSASNTEHVLHNVILDFFLSCFWVGLGSDRSPLVLNNYPLRKEGWQTIRNQLLVFHVNLLRNPYS